MALQDRVAIVTGGGSGFGEAFAHRFAGEGARVLIADISEEAGARVAKDIGAAGGTASVVQTDVSDRDDVASAVELATERYGRLDIVMNNAGIVAPKEHVTDLQEHMYDRLFAVNVKSIYLFAHFAAPVMRHNDGGVIINTASTAAVKPRPGNAASAASKAAVVTFTKALAVELVPDKIRVNALLPVAARTPLFYDYVGKGNEALVQQMEAAIPLGRMCEPADMAACAAFLASDAAAFVTGAALPVDGGWTAA